MNALEELIAKTAWRLRNHQGPSLWAWGMKWFLASFGLSLGLGLGALILKLLKGVLL